MALFKQAKTRALLILSCDDSGGLAEISYFWQETKQIGRENSESLFFCLCRKREIRRNVTTEDKGNVKEQR